MPVKNSILKYFVPCTLLAAIFLSFVSTTPQSTYADSICLQPDAVQNSDTLTQPQLDAYGLPRHLVDIGYTEWKKITLSIKHHYCTTTATKMQSASDLAFENWSGNIADGDNGYKEADATWNVPCIAAGSPAGESSAWAGLGGDGNTNLVQAGTNSNVMHFLWFSIPTYNAWVENLADPTNPYERIVFHVHCGDEMHVFINQGNYMYIVDMTSGASAIQQFGPVANASSAECIQERTTDNNQMQPLPDFRSIHFSTCHVTTSSNRILPMNNAQYDYSVMRGDDGYTPLVTLGPLGNQGAFTVNWLRANS
jgi:Peptidase A4 family